MARTANRLPITYSPARMTIALKPRLPGQVTSRVREDLRRQRAARQRWFALRMIPRHLTITEVSRKTGISMSYLSRIISGHRMPGLDTTMRLARELGVTLQQMADVLLPDLDLVDRHSGKLVPVDRTPRHEVIE